LESRVNPKVKYQDIIPVKIKGAPSAALRRLEGKHGNLSHLAEVRTVTLLTFKPFEIDASLGSFLISFPWKLVLRIRFRVEVLGMKKPPAGGACKTVVRSARCHAP
jgi:hypothetical protein